MDTMTDRKMRDAALDDEIRKAEAFRDEAILESLDPGKPSCDVERCQRPGEVYILCSCGHDLVGCAYHARQKRDELIRENAGDPFHGSCVLHDVPLIVSLEWRLLP